MTFDLAVLGAGPGGYEAAAEAAALGLSVVLVERAELGGTCLNRGCIPTKLMLGATAAIEELAGQARMRIAKGDIQVDLPGLVTRKTRLVEATRKAMAQKLAALGVETVQGEGSILGPGRVAVEGPQGRRELSCRSLVIATGSRPASFPGLTPDGDSVLDSTSFLELSAVPESLIVIGAGFIGLEMAQIAHRLGSRIHLLDAAARMAVAEDPEVSATLASVFKRAQWDIRLGVTVADVRSENGKARLTLADGQEIMADKALVAVGRKPNTEGLGVESLGAVPGKGGWLTTDGFLRIADNAYAIGDVNGRILLAHAASSQARYVAMRLAGKTQGPYGPGPVPSVLYGSPEVMRVGLMADELKQNGLMPRVSAAPFAASPIAQAHAQTAGFAKVVWNGERVAGITAVGHDASRLATAATIMVQEGWTREQAMNLIFAHPTLDEVLLAALSAEQKDA